LVLAVELELGVAEVLELLAAAGEEVVAVAEAVDEEAEAEAVAEESTRRKLVAEALAGLA
jgi:hypothetical protein